MRKPILSQLSTFDFVGGNSQDSRRREATTCQFDWKPLHRSGVKVSTIVYIVDPQAGSKQSKQALPSGALSYYRPHRGPPHPPPNGSTSNNMGSVWRKLRIYEE